MSQSEIQLRTNLKEPTQVSHGGSVSKGTIFIRLHLGDSHSAKSINPFIDKSSLRILSWGVLEQAKAPLESRPRGQVFVPNRTIGGGGGGKGERGRPPSKPESPKCSTPGCDNPAGERGLCESCIAQAVARRTAAQSGEIPRKRHAIPTKDILPGKRRRYI